MFFRFLLYKANIWKNGYMRAADVIFARNKKKWKNTVLESVPQTIPLNTFTIPLQTGFLVGRNLLDWILPAVPRSAMGTADGGHLPQMALRSRTFSMPWVLLEPGGDFSTCRTENELQSVLTKCFWACMYIFQNDHQFLLNTKTIPGNNCYYTHTIFQQHCRYFGSYTVLPNGIQHRCSAMRHWKGKKDLALIEQRKADRGLYLQLHKYLWQRPPQFKSI